MYRIYAPTIALSLLLGQLSVATQVSVARPAFTEASVKPVEPSIRDRTERQLTRTTFVDRAHLLEFIVNAYLDADGAGVCTSLIVAGHDCPLLVGSVPAWARTEKFEISARWSQESLAVETLERLGAFRFKDSVRRNVYPVEIQLMLQQLLEDTFSLKVRRERKEIPVWAITRRTQEPRLTYSASSEGRLARLSTRRNPTRPQDGRVTVVFEGSSVKDLTDFFTFYLERPVIDRSGLEGDYDFTLEFDEGDQGSPAKKGGLPMGMWGFDVARLASAFDGLGFNVESTTAPFDALIIEHVQRPSSGAVPLP